MYRKPTRVKPIKLSEQPKQPTCRSGKKSPRCEKLKVKAGLSGRAGARRGRDDPGVAVSTASGEKQLPRRLIPIVGADASRHEEMRKDSREPDWEASESTRLEPVQAKLCSSTVGPSWAKSSSEGTLPTHAFPKTRTKLPDRPRCRRNGKGPVPTCAVADIVGPMHAMLCGGGESPVVAKFSTSSTKTEPALARPSSEVAEPTRAKL